MEALKLILIRHGESSENAAGIVQGHHPGTLSDRGKEEAQRIATRLDNEKLDVVYSSDLERAFETARILLQNRNSISLITDLRLREQNFGIYEGRPLRVLLRQMKKEKVDFTNFDPRDGERSEDFRKRVKEFFDELKAKYFGKTVVLVTHFGVINALLGILTGKTLEKDFQDQITNGKVIILNIDGLGSTKVKFIT